MSISSILSVFSVRARNLSLLFSTLLYVLETCLAHSTSVCYCFCCSLKTSAVHEEVHPFTGKIFSVFLLCIRLHGKPKYVPNLYMKHYNNAVPKFDKSNCHSCFSVKHTFLWSGINQKYLANTKEYILKDKILKDNVSI